MDYHWRLGIRTKFMPRTQWWSGNTQGRHPAAFLIALAEWPKRPYYSVVSIS
jgi:hypothetical protein